MQYGDRIEETTSSTGTTSPLVLTGATAGNQSLATAGAETGDRIPYRASNGTAWETGEGIYTAGGGGTLARSTIYASSNGGAIVNFSGGTLVIACALPAVRFADKGLVYAFAARMVRR